MNYLSEAFRQFISPGIDRKNFLCSLLEKKSINYSIIPLDDKFHIYINFPKTDYNPAFKIKTLLVHYDRFGTSPGANDNSAAVFQLIDWIEHQNIYQHNMRIIFTDGEELSGLPSGKANLVQGSFALAELFKRLGLTTDDIYVLDCTGRGEVLVISTAGKDIEASFAFRKNFNSLYERAITIAKTVSPESWITAPVPYGDNAGFIANGIPAILISVLPKQEATEYLRDLQKNRSLKKQIMDHSDNAAYEPETWRRLHTQFDDITSLNIEAFKLIEKFLNLLAKEKTLR
jgi:hypothetical protein